MATQSLIERINIDPEICSGKPHIRGTRLKVSFVLDLLASEWTIETILEEYNHIIRDDILACLEYASQNLS